MGELRKHLFGRNRFPTIGLSDRKEQFSFLFRGKGEAAFAVSGQNSHRRPLFQGYAVNYDLTADNFSSSYLIVRRIPQSLTVVDLRRTQS